jgi:hypothetical protein
MGNILELEDTNITCRGKNIRGMADKGFTVHIYTACHFTVHIYTACHFTVNTKKQTFHLSPSLSPLRLSDLETLSTLSLHDGQQNILLQILSSQYFTNAIMQVE